MPAIGGHKRVEQASPSGGASLVPSGSFSEWLVQWELFWSLVDHGAVKLIRRTSDPN